MNKSSLHSHWQVPHDRRLPSTLTYCNYAVRYAPYNGFVPLLVNTASTMLSPRVEPHCTAYRPYIRRFQTTKWSQVILKFPFKHTQIRGNMSNRQTKDARNRMSSWTTHSLKVYIAWKGTRRHMPENVKFYYVKMYGVILSHWTHGVNFRMSIQFHCKKINLYNRTNELPYRRLLTPSGKVLHTEKVSFNKLCWQSRQTWTQPAANTITSVQTDMSTACCQYNYVSQLICQNRCTRIRSNAIILQKK
jgi:hypothetical protein